MILLDFDIWFPGDLLMKELSLFGPDDKQKIFVEYNMSTIDLMQDLSGIKTTR